MNKRALPLFFGSCIMVVAALGAYTLPDTKPDTPARILMRNSGGRVVFDHKAHVGYPDVTCQSCHHELNIPERELADAKEIAPSMVFSCGVCHDVKEGTPFAAEHQKTFERNDGGKTCLACHHTEDFSDLHVGETSPMPAGVTVTPCADCHTEVPDRMNAFHGRCFGCHDKTQKGPGSKAKCVQCHTQ